MKIGLYTTFLIYTKGIEKDVEMQKWEYRFIEYGNKRDSIGDMVFTIGGMTKNHPVQIKIDK